MRNPVQPSEAIGSAIPVPVGADVHLVINDEEFVNAAKSTYFPLLTARRVLACRHVEPARTG